MKTYNIKPYTKSIITRNNSTLGETIEQKVRRITTQKEPIKDGAPPIFTERKDGVRAETNIRTDRFEIAIDAMDKYQSSITAQRKSREKSPETEIGGEPSAQPKNTEN